MKKKNYVFILQFRNTVFYQQSYNFITNNWNIEILEDYGCPGKIITKKCTNNMTRLIELA